MYFVGIISCHNKISGFLMLQLECCFWRRIRLYIEIWLAEIVW
jgi:hypothetical protein